MAWNKTESYAMSTSPGFVDYIWMLVEQEGERELKDLFSKT